VLLIKNVSLQWQEFNIADHEFEAEKPIGNMGKRNERRKGTERLFSQTSSFSHQRSKMSVFFKKQCFLV